MERPIFHSFCLFFHPITAVVGNPELQLEAPSTPTNGSRAGAGPSGPSGAGCFDVSICPTDGGIATRSKDATRGSWPYY